MRVGLDGYPLCETLTGVGHYTLELSRALALNNPADQFELIAPFDFHPTVVAQFAREKSAQALVKTGVPDGEGWNRDLVAGVSHGLADLVIVGEVVGEGRKPADSNHTEMDVLWDEAKAKEKDSLITDVKPG